jgi:hypothetical protein
MKLSGRSVFHTEISSHDIRAITARMAHPDDPLADWKFEFEEWRKAYAEFQQMEQVRFLRAEPPGPLALREHRYVLFLLMTQGEELALVLMHSTNIDDSERNRLLEQVDAFLGSLRDSWHTWHGEALPEHRKALAGFLS